MKKIVIASILCLLVLFFLDPGSLLAVTYVMYVDDGGGNNTPYDTVANAATTIQAAVNYINTLTGNNLTDGGGDNVIIYVLDGNYTGGVNFNTYVTGPGNDIKVANYPGHAPEKTTGGIVMNIGYITWEGFKMHNITANRVFDIGNGAPAFFNNIMRNEIYNNSVTIIRFVTCSNIFIFNNDIHNNDNSGYHFVIRGTTRINITFQSNVFHDNDPGGADPMINVALGSTRVVFRENYFYNNINCLDVERSQNVEIFNNLFYNNTGPCIRFSPNNPSDFTPRIYNNTIHKNNDDGIHLIIEGGVIDNIHIFNNLITSNTGFGIYEDGNANITIYTCDFNLLSGNAAGQRSVRDIYWGPNNITNAGPGYLSVTFGNADFLKIDTGSPCIDQGMDASSYNLTNDYWWTKRPFDEGGTANLVSAYDIGAYEFFIASQDLHHFTISHDTNALAGVWERITITAMNSNNTSVWSNLGGITVDVAGALGTISWSNAGNCGNFTDLGSSFFYEFQDCGNGVLVFYIKDNTVDTVNIEVRSDNITFATDDDTEGDLYFHLPPDLRISKSRISPAGTIAPGDYIRYQIDYTNAGTLQATGVFITDTIPNNTIYSAGSLETSASGSRTDADDGDEAYYDSSANRVIFAVEGGSAPGTGGTLDGGAFGSVYFTVQVASNASAPPGSVTIPLDNTAQDGEIRDNGANANDNATVFRLGDWKATAREWWGLQGFNLDAIPAGSTITSATIGFYIIAVVADPNVEGLNPYRVDHVDFSNTINAGDQLASKDIQTAFYSFDYPGNNQWFYIPCGSQASNAFENSKAWSLDGSDKWFQVRYRCNQPSKDVDGYFSIVTTDDGANVPLHSYLKVYYTPPNMIIPDIVTNLVTITASNAVSTNAVLTNNITLPGLITLSVSKSIISVELDGSGISAPVPGSTITYQVNWSNQGPGSALNMIVYDQLPADVIYSNITPTGWIEQYSYSALPDQSWGSAVYSNMPPAVSSNVRWVRWINPSVPAGEAGSFTYTVIIK